LKPLRLVITGGPATGKTAIIEHLESLKHHCYEEVIRKHAEQVNKKTVFYDRGIPDVLAYMDYFKQDIPDNFNAICKEHTYDHVFLLPPWEAIYKTIWAYYY